jgi:hypothetical protein
MGFGEQSLPPLYQPLLYHILLDPSLSLQAPLLAASTTVHSSIPCHVSKLKGCWHVRYHHQDDSKENFNAFQNDEPFFTTLY